jgi:electron transfer flavoprotein alpha subunit
VAALAKQVPSFEALSLGSDGRLRRGGPAEMNPYCRRAVSAGVKLAKESHGTCTVFTLGPPPAEDVLREAVAWGADEGVHLCDPEFAGSDTLATARVLAAAVARDGPFDLVLVGRNSIDGETGQVGPELAELLGVPFASGVRELAREGGMLRLRLEHDDGWETVELELPAVLSTAERLIEPAKVDPAGRAAVEASRLRRLNAADLGPGPYGAAASPTRVGEVRLLRHVRAGRRLEGPVADQVAQAVALLEARAAFDPGRTQDETRVELTEEAVRSLASAMAVDRGDGTPAVVAVLLEPDRSSMAPELLGAARRLADEVGGTVAALRPERSCPSEPGALGADEVVELSGEPWADDVAPAVTAWARERSPWCLLAPSTDFGREVAARSAAALGAGLTGDAIAVEVVDGVLVAAKPAFAGALVADITASSSIHLVTVRPGALPATPPRPVTAEVSSRPLQARRRIRHLEGGRDDDVEVLARAEVVIGVGTGVQPDEYAQLSPLAALLGAELAATRKVTDKGWAPRARQVGITGRSISPRLYLALGLSGKFNHMVGVRGAGTILAVNPDPSAPVFAQADIGLTADWHDVVPELTAVLRDRRAAAVPISD